MFVSYRCDCNQQSEGYAVRNLATYGPAVVCFDASTWQDYTEGIITSESGCSSGFMDVNHCAQAVGYAYMSDEEYQDEVDGNKNGDNKNSNSKSGSGSGDSELRKGYWIVRNQWSKYWGMNGYAYVAMGENTCGILNDMMQAYT
jgi:Papain family cysteine protease